MESEKEEVMSLPEYIHALDTQPQTHGRNTRIPTPAPQRKGNCSEFLLSVADKTDDSLFVSEARDLSEKTTTTTAVEDYLQKLELASAIDVD